MLPCSGHQRVPTKGRKASYKLVNIIAATALTLTINFFFLRKKTPGTGLIKFRWPADYNLMLFEHDQVAKLVFKNNNLPQNNNLNLIRVTKMIWNVH